LKVKLTISYNPGEAPSEDGGHINNLQINIKAGEGVKVDKDLLRFEKLNMSENSSTPLIENFWVYPLKTTVHFD